LCCRVGHRGDAACMGLAQAWLLLQRSSATAPMIMWPTTISCT
jgi:hypothetical protein